MTLTPDLQPIQILLGRNNIPLIYEVRQHHIRRIPIQPGT